MFLVLSNWSAIYIFHEFFVFGLSVSGSDSRMVDPSRSSSVLGFLEVLDWVGPGLSVLNSVLVTELSLDWPWPVPCVLSLNSINSRFSFSSPEAISWDSMFPFQTKVSEGFSLLISALKIVRLSTPKFCWLQEKSKKGRLRYLCSRFCNQLLCPRQTRHFRLVWNFEFLYLATSKPYGGCRTLRIHVLKILDRT